MITSNEVPYGNYTEYGIQNPAERYTYAFYHILVLLSSLAGDTFILVASFNKDALKVNPSIVSIIRHIAICDILSAVFVVLPGAVSLITNSWILGDVMCHISVYLSHLCMGVGVSLIAALTTSKLLLLKFPLRSSWTRLTHVTCRGIWLVCLVNPVLMVVSVVRRWEKDNVFFDFRIYNCRHWSGAYFWQTISPVITFTILVVLNLCIIGTTIPTLIYLIEAVESARRVRASVPWQGALTVSFTALVYCISTLPTAIYTVGITFFEEKDSVFLIQLGRARFFLYMINTMANFYIYALTMRSFRLFLARKIFCNVKVSSLKYNDSSASATGLTH